MSLDRRAFLKTCLAAGGGLLLSGRAAVAASPGPVCCLMDVTLCIGCRKCEAACARANGLPEPAVPFDDLAVLVTRRRMDHALFTVVNRFGEATDPAFVKIQCMHCLDPACVSACPVSALTRDERGIVQYHVDRCIGCRYCMIACPFGVPAYEYHDAWTPRVRKCGLCADLVASGQAPACVTACPREAIAFGPRDDLLRIAHERIGHGPGRAAGGKPYLDHVYGETEAGGTGWIYLSSMPFDRIGLPALPDGAPPRLTESIQHGAIAGFLTPVAVFLVLGTAMFVLRERGGEEAPP